MRLNNYRRVALVICLGMLLGMGLHSAGAVRAHERGSGDKTPPGKSKPDKDSKKKKEPVKEVKSFDEMEDEEFEANLKFQQGRIAIKEGLATLSVPAGFRYLSHEQTERLLVRWGNPPGNETLGMLFPSAISPLSEEGWGVVISYQDDGYVKDDDAETIDYADLLKQIQEDLVEENQERKQKGFEAVTLVGWAAAPHYDRASHKLYWAKEFQFGDNDEHTLNYDVRVLGRKGTLVLSAVASITQLSAIEGSMQDVMAIVDFNDGERYADFSPGVDKIAAYGIGALIAGKVLVKVGFFKLLLGLILGAKKLAIPAFIAIGALLRKLFKRKTPEETETRLNLKE